MNGRANPRKIHKTSHRIAVSVAVMNPVSAEELRAAFVNCSKSEAAKIIAPELEHLRWESLDFLAWRSARAPQRAYLVAPGEHGLVGVVMRAAQSRNATGAVRSAMCEYCHVIHSAGGVTLFTASKAGAAGRRGDSIGGYFCSDLNCSLYVRDLKRPTRVQPQTTMTVDERVDRLNLRLSGLITNVLAQR